MSWCRKSKGDQTIVSCKKGWIQTSVHLEDKIMNPLEILAKQLGGVYLSHWGQTSTPERVLAWFCKHFLAGSATSSFLCHQPIFMGLPREVGKGAQLSWNKFLNSPAQCCNPVSHAAAQPAPERRGIAWVSTAGRRNLSGVMARKKSALNTTFLMNSFSSGNDEISASVSYKA